METEQKIIEIFDNHKIPLTIGVIPYAHKALTMHTVTYSMLTKNDPTSKLLLNIVNNNNFEIAMHGLTHHKNKISNSSEWIGLTLDEQTSMVKRGKDIIENSIKTFNIITFIPPWNSFDLVTTEALYNNKFKYLSGDLTIVKNKPFDIRNSIQKNYFGLNIIPGTCSLEEFFDVLKYAKESSDSTQIVVIFHPYDFQEYRGTRIQQKAFFNLNDLDNIIRKVKSDNSIICLRIKDLKPELIAPSRFTAACRYYSLLKLLIPKEILISLDFIDRGIGHWTDKGRYLGKKITTGYLLKCFL